MTTTLDTQRIETFAERMLGDLGTGLTAGLVCLGDRLGLYRALAEAGPATSEALAARTGTTERYVREWLANQAAAGYVDYEPATGRYTLPPEHAAVLADEASPAFLAGGFGAALALLQSLDRIEQAFRSGEGVGWHEHDHSLFHNTERFFRPGYETHLLDAWIPALEGVSKKLEAGARVADVGCGHGASTLILAGAFPRSRFVGFDYHAASVEAARRRAAEAGAAANVDFEVAGAADFEGEFDLVAMFDALHDMGDPVGAASHVLSRLAPDGTFLLVEPMAGDRLEENLHPLGQAFYGFSTLACTPGSLAQEGRCGLGGQAGEARLREVLVRAGFTRIRRAAETPVNLVIEAKR